MERLSCEADIIVFAPQTSGNTRNLIIRQAFSLLQRFLVLPLQKKDLCSRTTNFEPQLFAHWNRFHRFKRLLCNAEVAFLKNGELGFYL